MNCAHKVDSRFNRVNGEVRVVVEITQKRDGEAIETRRPASQVNLLFDELKAIGLDEDSVCGERTDSRGRCEPDQISAADTKRCQSVFERHTLEYIRCNLRLSEYSAGGTLRYDDKNALHSEVERRDQVDAAIRCRPWGEWKSLNVVGDTEKLRAQNSARIRDVHVVEGVAQADPESKVVAPLRVGRHRGRTATTAKQRPARTTTSAATAARTPGSTLFAPDPDLFVLGPKPNVLVRRRFITKWLGPVA